MRTIDVAALIGALAATAGSGGIGNLTVTTEGRGERGLRDVSFEVRAGEIVARARLPIAVSLPS